MFPTAYKSEKKNDRAHLLWPTDNSKDFKNTRNLSTSHAPESDKPYQPYAPSPRADTGQAQPLRSDGCGANTRASRLQNYYSNYIEVVSVFLTYIRHLYSNVHTRYHGI